MIDISLPYSDLFCALFKEQLKLEAFANLSIIASTQEKDNYLADALAWVRNQSIDPACGGIYRIENNHCHYDCVTNAVIACWLLCAGRALYSGELTQYGLRMIGVVERDFWNAQESDLTKVVTYDIESVPFIQDREQLEYLLSNEERALLDGFTSKALVDGNNACVFRNSMIVAAKKAGMHLKQAQIVDFSLRKKLFDLSIIKINQTSKNKLSVREESLVFSCLTQALLWHSRELKIPFYSLLTEKIQQRVWDNQYENISHLIGDLYTLAESRQLYANSDAVAYLDKITEALVSKFELGERYCKLSKLESIMAARLISACTKFTKEPSYQKRFENLLKSIDLIECELYLYHHVIDKKNRFSERYRLTAFLSPLAL